MVRCGQSKRIIMITMMMKMTMMMLVDYGQ